MILAILDTVYSVVFFGSPLLLLVSTVVRIRPAKLFLALPVTYFPIHFVLVILPTAYLYTFAPTSDRLEVAGETLVWPRNIGSLNTATYLMTELPLECVWMAIMCFTCYRLSAPGRQRRFSFLLMSYWAVIFFPVSYFIVGLNEFLM